MEKQYSQFDIDLDSLAMERKKLSNEMQELKKRIDNVNNSIKTLLDERTEYKTEFFKFVYKEVVTPEHMVKESVSRPLKVY